ncbi:hypothetical protein CAPTEDRAFT_181192 [Capitella teleta]|uniref:protein acetyllysine N-acetyltransferase n=1 Tax=Capitella teleta TaxID=283909 RepID=R7UFJ9_CAPTE|nr:hypothetical protein CAPTEDRAFT_181192 [Capitella teleta]|eukprot:ELU05314.1 hypothetical protein CAPTEDRAFT_181192 [Capitella teleta]
MNSNSTISLRLRLTNPKPSSHQKSEASAPSSAPEMTCCLHSCLHDNHSIMPSDERIEVTTTLPPKSSAMKFKIAWGPKGGAKFHRTCWDAVVKSSRARAKKSIVVEMSAKEKEMVKVAAKTAETHDSLARIQAEAKRIAAMITKAKHLVAFTGAGISTSAGIGDFRGKSGKWTEEDRHGYDHEPEAKRSRVDSDSNGVEGEEVPYEDLRPTFTHDAIFKLSEMNHLKHIISQNADGLHLLSGISHTGLSELHGNVFIERCEKCGHRYERSFYVMDDVACEYFEEKAELGHTDIIRPKHAKECTTCGLNHRTGRMCEEKNCDGHLMDSIINFGDLLEAAILKKAEDEAKKSDVMLILGSTVTVTPASALVTMGTKPLKLIICNRQKTQFDDICDEKDKTNGEKHGARVFGDCDVLMREVMKCILSQDAFEEWNEQRKERLRIYNENRPK